MFEERENKTRDVVVLLVQGKMAGVERVDFGIRQIALERLRSGAMNEGSFGPQTTKIGACAQQPCLPRGRLISARVIRVVLTVGRPLLVYPDERTCSVFVGMCQRCHERKS